MNPEMSILTVWVGSNCNAACTYCAYRYNNLRQQSTGKSASLSLVEDALRRWPTITKIAIASLGEPLIQPETFSIMQLAASRNLAVDVTTNCMALDDRYSTILANTSGCLCVSIDSINQDVLDKVTPGIRFETLAANLKQFYQKQPRHPDRSSYANIVVTDETKHTLVETAHFIMSLGVYGLRLVRVFSTDITRIKYLAEDDAVVQKALAIISAEGSSRGIAVEDMFTGNYVCYGGANNVHCVAPWNHLTVTGDGTFTTCCISDIPLDNDSADPFLGSMMVELRKQMLAGVIDPTMFPHCATCQQTFPTDWSLLHEARRLVQAESTVCGVNRTDLEYRGSASLEERLIALDQWVEQRFSIETRPFYHRWVRWRVLGIPA